MAISPRRKSVMTHAFSQVPQVNIPRSTFDRSHGHKTTFDAGYIVPVLWDLALPGDTFKCRMNAFARMSTPLKPSMDNLYLSSFFFAVPIRLLWTNFEKFCGAQVNPGDSTSYTLPKFNALTVGIGETGDYLGWPYNLGGLTPVSLWNRAYNKIYNEWFRDQNMQNSLTVDTGDGPDTYANYSALQRRGKRHDYFTSCLPWPQKGVAVSIPVGSSTAPVKGTGISLGMQDGTNNFGLASDASGNMRQYNAAYGAAVGGAGGTTAGAVKIVGVTTDGTNSGLIADLSSAFATSINVLRQGFQLQRAAERDARGGTRLVEVIKAHFGVISPDFRMARSEYLGGGRVDVNMHPIPMTAMASGGTAAGQQGNLAAFGTVSAMGHGFTKSFTEHCIILGFVCIDADLTYQRGLHRMFSAQNRFDLYWPVMAQIGEQAVLNQEIWYNNNPGTGAAQDQGVFGYQERYAEYRYKPSQISGKFRSTYATPLDVWHWSQNFTSLPALNSTFIVSNPPISRNQAVTTEPQFLLDAYFQYICSRPMPVFGVPGNIDRL